MKEERKIMDSQFQKLVRRVDNIELKVNNGGDFKQGKNKLRALEDAAENFARAQQTSKNVLNDLNATPEQLQAITPFLTSPGHKAFAELEIEKKTAQRAMAEQLAAAVKTFEPNGQLIENMKQAAKDGYYDTIRASMSPTLQAFGMPQAMPERKHKQAKQQSPKPSANAMRAAQELADRQRRATVAAMMPHRGPLGTSPRGVDDALWPNPVNGVVI